MRSLTTTPSTYVGQLMEKLYGINVLLKSTLSGKMTTGRKDIQKLDETKLALIKGKQIFKNWTY